MDLLLLKWDAAYRQLEAAEAGYEASGLKKRPQHRLGCCGCSGAQCMACQLLAVGTLLVCIHES